MKLDLHIHSKYSPDGRMEIEDIIKTAKARGLDGVAVTDHNSVKGGLSALEFCKGSDFLVIPGIEVSTTKGHVLGLGVACLREPEFN